MSSFNRRLRKLYKVTEQYLIATGQSLDKYTSRKSSVSIDYDKGKVTLSVAAHIQFAKYGRGPGKKPPLDNILEWIKRESIKFEGLSVNGTAFAIQTSIGKHGTKNYKPNAPDAVREALQENYKPFSKEFDRVLSTQMDEYLKEKFGTIVIKKV